MDDEGGEAEGGVRRAGTAEFGSVPPVLLVAAASTAATVPRTRSSRSGALSTAACALPSIAKNAILVL